MWVARCLLALGATLGVCGVCGACGEDDAASFAGPGGGDRIGGDVVVFAAASLTDAFEELGEAFEAAYPGAEVGLNVGASSELVAQIGEGAPADVFASADVSTMTRLADAGDAGSEPVVFTRNRAQIVVERDNPAGVTGVADLADPDLVVVSCAPEVPCGRYAQRIFDNAGVTVTPRSLEENVRAVVSKVTLGEADAGIVYVTDVLNAGDAADGVDIPAGINVVAEYPIVVTENAPHPAAAQAFVDFVLADEGQAILDSYGFVAP